MRVQPSAFAGGALLALLGLTVVLIAILAWQAFSAVRSHRALGEQVLHDYADLAATEFVRRSTHVVGTYGFAAALAGLVRAAPSGGELPTREAMAAAVPGQSRRAMELVDTLFSVPAAASPAGVDAGADVDVWSRPLPAGLARSLTEAAALSRDRRSDHCVAHPTIDGATRSFVFTCEAVGDKAALRRLGFGVRADALTAWLAEFAAGEPLLPPSLATRDAAQSSLHVTVRDPHGDVVFRSPHEPPAAFTSARRQMTGEGGERDFAGFEVEVAIDRSAADRLVIGGLPQSRVGLLLALLAVTLGLVAAAVTQNRRERDLAIAREDFVSRASHELRTPVARIQMFTDTLLLGRVRSDEEREQALSALNRSARRLSFLIDNILRSSRPDAGAVASRIARVDLSAIVADVVDEFGSTLDDRARVVVRCEAGVEAEVDREALRQILLNLLDNADKYGGRRSSIQVELGWSAAGVRLSVQDQGPGVPENERSRVWRPYYRLERDRLSAVTGTGIGLAVVRDLVASQGGRHTIEDSPGGGARFVVVFPATHTPAGTPPQAS